MARRAHRRLHRLVFRVLRVGKFHQRAAVFPQQLDAFLPHRFLKARAPIVPVHHIVRLPLPQRLAVADIVLPHHPVHALDAGNQLHALFTREHRVSFVGGDHFVRQHAHRQFSQLCRTADHLDMPAVDHIRAHAQKYGLFLLIHVFRLPLRARLPLFFARSSR